MILSKLTGSWQAQELTVMPQQQWRCLAQEASQPQMSDAALHLARPILSDVHFYVAALLESWLLCKSLCHLSSTGTRVMLYIGWQGESTARVIKFMLRANPIALLHSHLRNSKNLVVEPCKKWWPAPVWLHGYPELLCSAMWETHL
jgi:hypothetical protein